MSEAHEKMPLQETKLDEIDLTKLAEFKRYWYRACLTWEGMGASPEMTAVTIALSDVRDKVQQVPGCEEFWRLPFNADDPS